MGGIGRICGMAIGRTDRTGAAGIFCRTRDFVDERPLHVVLAQLICRAGPLACTNGGDECITFVIDLTKRKRAERALEASLAELRASEEKLHRFAAREVAVREAERKRLGFDLHDNVCQELTGVGMLLASVRHRLGARQTSLATDLVRAGDFLAEIVEHLRVMARELRPLQLRDLGLGESLTALATRMSSPTTSVVARVPAPIPRLGDDVELSVYRVAQEALANALRHGHPRSIVVTLVADDGRLRLEVRDDGCGFDPALRPRDALGLTGMEERAAAVRLTRGRPCQRPCRRDPRDPRASGSS